MTRERVTIERVYLVDGLPEKEASQLMDLTMTIRDRSKFHPGLKQMGYYVREGESGPINELGQIGTIFGMFRLINEERSDEKVATITTALVVDNDE